MAIPPRPLRPTSSSAVADDVWIDRTPCQRQRPIEGRADGPTRTIRSGRRTGVVWGIGVCLLAGIAESPVRADGFAPVPVGTAIRGSDLLVPLRLAKPAGDLPDRVVVQIDETEIEADVAVLAPAARNEFRWVTPNRPIDVWSPSALPDSSVGMAAVAVVPIPVGVEPGASIEIASASWTPTWLAPLAAWDQRLPVVDSLGGDADPVEDDPLEWFRWVIRSQLSARRPPVDRMASSLESRVALAVADEWRAGLRRVARYSPSISRTIGERLVATVGDGSRASRERQVAMWPTDARELAGLRNILLDPSRTDEEAALAGLTWFEVRPPFVAWIVDVCGDVVTLRMGNPTVDEVIVFARFSTSNSPEALILPPRSLTSHTVERRGLASAGSEDELVLSVEGTEVRLEVGPRLVRVEPPGASFGPMVIGRTLASVNGEFVEMPELPAQTAGILRRRFGRWEIFVEARGPRSEDPDDDRVYVQLGPSDRPVAVLEISRSGRWRIDSGLESEPIEVEVVEHPDRWRFLVQLPERWLMDAINRSSEGGVRLGLRRDGPRGIVQFAGPPPAAWRRRIPTQNFGLSWWDDPEPPEGSDF